MAPETNNLRLIYGATSHVFVIHAQPKGEIKILSTILPPGLPAMEGDVSLAGETYRMTLRRLTAMRRFTLRALARRRTRPGRIPLV